MSEQQEKPSRPETLEAALARIGELEAHLKNLRERIDFDKLTREFGIYRGERAKEIAMRWLIENDFSDAGVLRMDMANLREINNRYDHETGNQAIKVFGRFLRSTIEKVKKHHEIKEALAFRVHDAGDEFGLFFLGGISTQKLSEIMEIMKAMPPALQLGGEEIGLGFTVGSATTQDFDVKERIEILKPQPPEDKAAEIWNILNVTAGFDERQQRKLIKSQENNHG